MTTKASKEHWEKVNSTFSPHMPPSGDTIRNWILKYIPENKNGRCIEIGCYPGRYLTVFGDLGYEVNGLDITKDVGKLPEWLMDRGYNVGEIRQCDFLQEEIARQYDVVSSFGFIEHFTDWEAVIQRHMKLVADGGYLVIQVPNFIGAFQNFIHNRYDLANVERHVLDAMYVDEWIPILAESEFRIIYKGYFGGFSFWIDETKNLNALGLFLYKMYLKMKPHMFKMPDTKAYSPLAGIIAKKVN